jgi:hypothetical protein
VRNRVRMFEVKSTAPASNENFDNHPFNRTSERDLPTNPTSFEETVDFSFDSDDVTPPPNQETPGLDILSSSKNGANSKLDRPSETEDMNRSTLQQPFSNVKKHAGWIQQNKTRKISSPFHGDKDRRQNKSLVEKSPFKHIVNQQGPQTEDNISETIAQKTIWPSPENVEQRDDYENGDKDRRQSKSLVEKSPFKHIVNQKGPKTEETISETTVQKTIWPSPENVEQRDDYENGDKDRRQSKSLVEKSPFKHIVNQKGPKTEEAMLETIAQETITPSPENAEQRDDYENEAPQAHSSIAELEREQSPRYRTSRALRLMRTKRTEVSSVPTKQEIGLKQSLDAASVVMEEEKSNAGSSSASSRSSLSNQELGKIALQALTLSKNQESTITGNFQHTLKNQNGENKEESFTPKIRKDDIVGSHFRKPRSSISIGSGLSKPTEYVYKHLQIPRNDSGLTDADETGSSVSMTSEARLENRISRAGKLAQVLHYSRTTFPDEDNESMVASESSFPPTGRVSLTRSRILPPGKPDDGSDCLSITSDTSRSSARRAGLVSAVRRTRSVTNVSHQEARRALLIADKRKKEKIEAIKQQMAASEAINQKEAPASVSDKAREAEKLTVAERLGSKASRAVALKQALDLNRRPLPRRESIDDTATVTSVDSKSSQRMSQHPAFVSRASPTNFVKKDKPALTVRPFSEEMFSGLRHFTAARGAHDTDTARRVCPPGTIGNTSHVCNNIPNLTSLLRVHSPYAQAYHLTRTSAKTQMLGIHKKTTFLYLVTRQIKRQFARNNGVSHLILNLQSRCRWRLALLENAWGRILGLSGQSTSRILPGLSEVQTNSLISMIRSRRNQKMLLLSLLQQETVVPCRNRRLIAKKH